MIIDNIKTQVVGVNINVDKTACAIVDVRGNIKAMDSFATSEYPDVSNFVTVLCNHIMTLLEENGGLETVRSVGISTVSGNFQTGCIENSPNLPWKGVVPLAAMLRAPSRPAACSRWKRLKRRPCSSASTASSARLCSLYR